MRPLLLVLALPAAVLGCVLQASTAAPAAPPSIPGTRVIANLGAICPRDAPLAFDVNGDGTDDLLSPGYQAEPFAYYPPPKSLTTLKVVIANTNFAHAAVVDGKTLRPLWTFRAGAMINASGVSADRKRLYLGSHDDTLTAIDIASGRTLWRQDLRKNILGLSIAPQNIVAMSAANVVKAFRPEDGSVLWEQPVKAALMATGFGVMLADDATVYVSTLDDAVHAFDRRSGAKRWTVATGGNPSLRLVVRGALLIADKKTLRALDLKTGTQRWSFDAGGWLHIAPILDLGERVAIQQTSGEQRIIALDDVGRLVWTHPFEEPVLDKKRSCVTPEDAQIHKTGLAVETGPDGRPSLLYVAGTDSIRCLRASDGGHVWSAPIEDAQALLLSGGRLVAAGADNVIHSLDTATGKEQWQHEARRSVAQLARLGDSLLATLYSKELVVLGLEDGKPRGAILELGDPYRLVPQGEDRVIVCSEAGTVVLAPAAPAAAAAPDEPAEQASGDQPAR